MITCRELVEVLIDFVSGELAEEHRLRIEQHLRLCPPCVAYIETYQVTIRLTRKLACEPLSPECAERLMASLGKEPSGGEPAEPLV